MRIETHAHTEFSQLRMLDCIVKVQDLIKKAAVLGLGGVAITDHESISGHVRFIQIVKKLKSSGVLPEDFKGILGNEIYLVDTIEVSDEGKKSCPTPFYHFILLAKDEIGHAQLRELSSLAWDNSFYTGKMERVPTLKKDLERIIKNNPGHLIGTTACLGGELGKSLIDGKDYETFILWCKNLFADDLYLEMQPGLSADQILLNKAIVDLSSKYEIKTTIACDVHYLNQEDRDIHAAYLNSREDEERELGDFYESTWLMNDEQIHERMDLQIGYENVEIALKNSYEIGLKIEEYDLFCPTIVPGADIPEFELDHLFNHYYDRYEFIKKFAESENVYDRYLLKLIEDGYYEKVPFNTMSKENFLETLDRIEVELKEMWLVTEKLGTSISSYYISTRELIEIMWNEGDSLVGVARGSVTGMFTMYLIGIVQMNPMQWGLPHWRHISHEKVELSDVDIDTEQSKRMKIIEAVKARKGERKVLNCCTFKTEGSKSAIITAGRGLGLDSDTTQYLSNMIPVTRGFTWSIHDCLHGDEEKERKPQKEFANEARKYPRLLETAQAIEGLICGRSIHASAVYLFNEDFLAHNARMKAPNGVYTTQFNMKDSDYCSGLKMDFLTIEALDKIRICMELLIKAGYMEWQGSLRATYNKYLHPDVIDYDTKEMWDMASNNDVTDLFQFDTAVGLQAAKRIKPHSLVELATANSIMRLMVSGEGAEQPIDTYIRYKNNIDDWYKCMREEYKLTENEIKILEKYLLPVYGVGDTQEIVMEISMDEHISGFNVTQSNKLRKGIAKKDVELQEAMKQMFFEHGKEIGTSENMLNYIWKEVVGKQLGYSFSKNHTFPYSCIGLQELNLAYHYPIIYWNTACLIVNAGANDEVEDNKSTDYGKIARAIANFKERDINVARPLINEAKFSFVPDESNNRIVFSFKGLNGIGDDIARAIVENQPYASFEDFCTRLVDTKIIGTSKMIILIKAGCFNELDSPDRKETMKKFLIRNVYSPTEKLTMQQFNSVVDYGLIPTDMQHLVRIKNFKAYALHESFFLKNIIQNGKKLPKKGYHDRLFGLDDVGTQFLLQNFSKCILGTNENGAVISEKAFVKEWETLIQPLKDFFSQESTLEKYNQAKTDEVINVYASGELEKWDMESLSYYPERHELWNLNEIKYGIVDFNHLPTEPDIYDYYTRTIRGEIKHMPKYQIVRLAGTVLDSDNNKHTVTLLTNHGVVTCKYNKGHYAYYNKRLSEPIPDTDKKKVIEESWFKRGSKIIVSGFRRDDQFVVSRYKDTIYLHTTNKIQEVYPNGDLLIQTERTRIGDD